MAVYLKLHEIIVLLRNRDITPKSQSHIWLDFKKDC